MWILYIIGGLIVIVTILYLALRNRMLNNLSSQGGMKQKYRVLIDQMLVDPLWSIGKEKKGVISIVGKNKSGNAVLSEFQIFQFTNSITIRYTLLNAKIKEVCTYHIFK